MLDVAFALGSILRLAGTGREPLQSLNRLIERHSPPGGYVEHLSGHLDRRSLTGQQVAFNNVVDVGEITALFTIAINDGRLASQHYSNELRQHSGVRRRRILAGAEDVK